MNIEDRMSLWAAKRPREEPAELMLEGAQEIADLRRKRAEDAWQMSALIEGYGKMQALCIDGKYPTDEERKAVERLSASGDCPASENETKQDIQPPRTGSDDANAGEDAAKCTVPSKKLPERERVANHPVNPDSSTLTAAEREAVVRSERWARLEGYVSDAAALRGLLNRQGGGA